MCEVSLETNPIDQIIQKMQDRGIERTTPVDTKKIREAEELYQIEFPQDLVEFYTKVSNGCRMIDGFPLYKFEDWRFNSRRITQIFPFDKAYLWADDNNADLSVVENGNIELIDIGDCQTWNIIINGNQKGKMWFFTDVGIQPAAPAKTFLDWFRYWLDGNSDYFTDYL